MDLRVFSEVLWRFRRLLVAGAGVALLLAILSVAKPTFIGLEYRDPEVWISNARMLVTQPGFPQGRSDINLNDGAAPAAPADGPPGGARRQFADPARLVELAVIYARLARSDPVRLLIRRSGRVEGARTVDVVNLQDLPIVEVAARGTSRRAAVTLAQRQTDALREYLRRQQANNGVPYENRIQLKVVERPGSPPLLGNDSNTWIVEPHSKIRPAAVFLAVVGLFIGLAFLLENLQPRLRAVGEDESGGKIVRAAGFPRG
jgi:hypothetical protein